MRSPKLFATLLAVVLVLVSVAVSSASAEETGDGAVFVNVYTTACSDVADIDGCYDVYFCDEAPSYDALIAGISVTADCVRVLTDVQPDQVPNPSVPAAPTSTPPPAPVILFTG